MGFRMDNRLPEFYEFQNGTKVISGKNAAGHIPAELLSLGAKRPLVLSDAMLAKIGTLKIVTDALLEEGVTPGEIYTDIPADSSTDVVNTIAAVYREKNCDSLVAVGGHSVNQPEYPQSLCRRKG